MYLKSVESMAHKGGILGRASIDGLLQEVLVGLLLYTVSVREGFLSGGCSDLHLGGIYPKRS